MEKTFNKPQDTNCFCLHCRIHGFVADITPVRKVSLSITLPGVWVGVGATHTHTHTHTHTVSVCTHTHREKRELREREFSVALRPQKL